MPYHVSSYYRRSRKLEPIWLDRLLYKVFKHKLVRLKIRWWYYRRGKNPSLGNSAEQQERRRRRVFRRSRRQATVGQLLYLFIPLVFSTLSWIGNVTVSIANRSNNSTNSSSITVVVVLRGLIFSLAVAVLAWTIAAVPHIGTNMSPVASRRMRVLGRFYYIISGLAFGIIIGFGLQSEDIYDLMLRYVVALSILVNSVCENYCIRKWDAVKDARRDIAKFLFRFAVLQVIAAGAIVIQATGVTRNLGLGLSLLMLPLALEAVYVVRKSQPLGVKAAK